VQHEICGAQHFGKCFRSFSTIKVFFSVSENSKTQFEIEPRKPRPCYRDDPYLFYVLPMKPSLLLNLLQARRWLWPILSFLLTNHRTKQLRATSLLTGIRFDSRVVHPLSWIFSFSPKRFPVYLLTYGAEPFLRSCQLYSHTGTPQYFNELEGSPLYSQEPTTRPYPEPDRSSP
jgi:hypothetical protein